MKKINKIASFISGITLCFQPLVGAMFSGKSGLGYLDYKVNKKPSAKEYINQLNSQNYLENLLKLSKTALKFKIYKFAKDIRDTNLKNKELPYDAISKIIDDVLNFESGDSATDIIYKSIIPIAFDNLTMESIKKSMSRILLCTSKKNTALDAIADNNDIDYMRKLYVFFDVVYVFTL